MPDRLRPGSTMTMHSTAGLQGSGDKCAIGAKTTTRLPKEETTIGTWNVCSLHACGKVQELAHELKHYQWDILTRSVGQVLEKLPWMKDRISSTEEKTQNTSMWWHSLCGKKLYVVSAAALLSPAGSSPSRFQRDQTTSQSFRSLHEPQNMKTRRSSNSMGSLIV